MAKKAEKKVEEKVEKEVKVSEKKAAKKVSKKKPAKKKEKKVKKTGYFKSLKSELSKVKWPSFKEVIKYSFITVVFCIVLALFFQLMDLISSFVKGLFN